MSLSVELGPGLIGTIYDGIQRPLEHLMEASGAFMARGLSFDAIDHTKLWHFKPTVKVGDAVKGGTILGLVQETNMIEHRVMVSPTITEGSSPDRAGGRYNVEQTIATIAREDGTQISMRRSGSSGGQAVSPPAA